MDSKKQDLKINGFADAPGGEYGAVRVNGMGRITGDVYCQGAFTVNGSGDVTGNVISKSLQINGSGHICGSLNTDSASICGIGDIEGKVVCQELSVSGSAHIKKDLNAQTVKVSGSLKIKDGCNAERFESTGIFEVGGLLNADSVDVVLHWSKSRAKEIGGESITVRRGLRGLDVIRQIFSVDPGLEADIIEGTFLHLEHTHAKVVRGRNVTLGSGCEIGVVEYTDTLRKTGGANVGEEKKI